MLLVWRRIVKEQITIAAAGPAMSGQTGPGRPPGGLADGAALAAQGGDGHHDRLWEQITGDAALKDIVHKGLTVESVGEGKRRLADALYAVSIAPFYAILKIENTSWSRGEVVRFQQKAQQIKTNIEGQLYEIGKLGSEDSKKRLIGLGRARAELLPVRLLTNLGVDKGLLECNADECRSFYGSKRGVWNHLHGLIMQWRQGEDLTELEHKREWKLFWEISILCRSLPGGKAGNHTHTIPIPQMRPGEMLFEMADIAKGADDSEGWFSCQCGCNCRFRIHMPDADDIELLKQIDERGNLRMSFRLSCVDGFEKGSTPIFLDHYQLAQKQQVLALYQGKILDLLGLQAKAKLDTLKHILGDCWERDWIHIQLGRTENLEIRKEKRRKTRHSVRSAEQTVLVPRSPEGLQRLQMASRLFDRKGGAVSFLVGQPATIGKRRELVVGHINEEGQYTDCNLASVNAGILHANLWKLTPETIRKRFEDAERQAQRVSIDTCTSIENFPTAVNLLRNELCPVDPKAAKKWKRHMQDREGKFKPFRCSCRGDRCFSLIRKELADRESTGTDFWQQRWLAHWPSCQWNMRRDPAGPAT